MDGSLNLPSCIFSRDKLASCNARPGSQGRAWRVCTRVWPCVREALCQAWLLACSVRSSLILKRSVCDASGVSDFCPSGPAGGICGNPEQIQWFGLASPAPRVGWWSQAIISQTLREQPLWAGAQPGRRCRPTVQSVLSFGALGSPRPAAPRREPWASCLPGECPTLSHTPAMIPGLNL